MEVLYVLGVAFALGFGGFIIKAIVLKLKSTQPKEVKEVKNPQFEMEYDSIRPLGDKIDLDNKPSDDGIVFIDEVEEFVPVEEIEEVELVDEDQETRNFLNRIRKTEGSYPPPKDAFVRLDEGCTRIRILPPMKDYSADEGESDNIYETRRQHYNTGNFATQCSKTLQGDRWVGNCPICDRYNELWSESRQHDMSGDTSRARQLQESARNIKPVERFYYNVIVRGQENKGPQIYAVPKSVHKQIIELMLGREGDYGEEPLGDITDPIEGLDLRVIKEQKGPFPQYTVVPTHKPSPLGTNEQMRVWLNNMWSLAKAVCSWSVEPKKMCLPPYPKASVMYDNYMDVEAARLAQMERPVQH